MKAVTPRENDGARRGIERTLTSAAPPGRYPQAARPAVEMWIIEFPQIAAGTCSEGLDTGSRAPYIPAVAEHGTQVGRSRVRRQYPQGKGHRKRWTKGRPARRIFLVQSRRPGVEGRQRFHGAT